MRRLLFLIADTGGGHRAAATAVARRLEATRPGEFAITVLDPFAEASPRAVGAGADLYGPLTRRARWLWGALWHATNSAAAVAALNRSVLRIVAKGVDRSTAAIRPHAIVSFHPLLNQAMVRAANQATPRPATITVVTDLVDIHASWAATGVDAVVVPSPGGLDQCRRAGIPGDRVHQFGLPVDERFTAKPAGPAAKTAARHRLGLERDRFTLLVCGGADGSGGIDRRARAVAAAGLDVQLAVITGRNQRARRRLQGLRDAAGHPVAVRGFVDDMPEWLRAADLVATKAGPGTIAETLCSGVPLLLTSYLPGQERGNVSWVTATGAGRYVPTVRQLVDAVAELSVPGSEHLAAMREAVRLLAPSDATARIAALIGNLAEGRGVA
ncbi:MAG: galactosyldiacylglycerol synthase [Candidatus Dormibacteraeota bacterium]|nr:galactosyldiacylglycerol synthase [Candidatus Dormibacteraeota bacterium]